MGSKKILLNEGSSTYKRNGKLFIDYLKASKRSMSATQDESIKAFLIDLKRGYPNGKVKTMATCRVKLTAIKNLYEFNKIEPKFSFKDIQKWLPDVLFNASGEISDDEKKLGSFTISDSVSVDSHEENEIA